jgi:hypothetical protein
MIAFFVLVCRRFGVLFTLFFLYAVTNAEMSELNKQKKKEKSWETASATRQSMLNIDHLTRGSNRKEALFRWYRKDRHNKTAFFSKIENREGHAFVWDAPF